MDYKKLDIFNPIIVVLLVILYLIFSLISYENHIRNLVGVSYNTITIIFLGLLFYIIGVSISRYFLKNKSLEINSDKLSFLFSRRNLVLLVCVGILLQIINLVYLGGIPLFSGYLKARAATRIWLLSYLVFLPSINLLIAKYHDRKYYVLFLIGLMLFVATGYRTTAMAIVISVLITLYYTRDIPWKYLILAIVAIFILLLVIGYVAVQSIEWQTWTLNPLELLFYRAGYTLQVLDNAVGLAGATHGQLLYNTLMGFFHSTDPRVIVGQTTLGYAHSTTSMIFGPAILDFGIYAMLIQMLIIGLIMGGIYYIQRSFSNIYTVLYAMLLAHVIIWIETGPTDLVVLLFFVISIIIILYTINRGGD
ncbi:MAG: oligosaccharide repeat unit polymerase family protein [Methanosphaera sp.]|nr:oligosaccharide repeat unit polymerase family protein [Methanosphaera sp.]